MRPIFAISFAVLYGLTLRLFFGFIGDLLGIMSLAFLVVGPFVIGFLTVFLMPKKRSLTGSAAFFIPWLTSLVILIITIVVNIEGTICWMMIYPLFAILAGLGGLFANKFRKKKVEVTDPENYDYWTKPDKIGASLLLLAPVLLGALEGGRTLSRKDMIISKEIIVTATPAAIWKALANINTIQPTEKHISFSSLLGFPKHISTTLDTLSVGGKRMARYEKGLYFEETISSFNGQSLVLDVKTDPANIPPTVMDEHILIGGKHVDILQDVYRVQDLHDGTCRIGLSSHFFINTPFNWYAGIWANWLMSDILNEELNLVKARAASKEN